jgi:pilus assembly protein CpaC
MRRRLVISLAGLAVLGGLIIAARIAPVHGQPPNAVRFINGKPAPTLPQVPTRDRHSLDELKKFVKDLSQNDATIQIIVRQGKLLSLKSDLVKKGQANPLIAVGDPRVIDVEPVGLRHLRITGQTMGVTDLAIMTADGKNYNFEVEVVADLSLLKARLKQTFPDAEVELNHLRQHIIVGGQARDARQVAQILAMTAPFRRRVGGAGRPGGGGGGGGGGGQPGADPGAGQPPAQPRPKGKKAPGDEEPEVPVTVTPVGGKPTVQSQISRPQIINLLRVPGPQQILLKVQVAELNRTALRQLGVSFLVQDRNFAIGTSIGGGIPGGAGGGAGGGAAGGAGGAMGALGPLLGLTDPLAAGATAFGVFERGKLNFFFSALRQNQVLKILAEPNLVAMNGQTANFLAGGEFPVPVPQTSGAGAGTVTIQYKEFGVKLGFVPYILDDDRIRLAVEPEVSSIDFSLGTTIQGTSVPALSTRRTNTTVELGEGQTLAISGILQVTLDGTTSRIPGLGDLPYIGSMFRNTTSTSVEKELIVLVTPYLVQPLDPEQTISKPGDDVDDPTDIELYLLGRIERRACRTDFRATTAWDDPLDVEHRRRIEERHVIGPYGYTQ